MSDKNPHISSTRKLRLGEESDKADREFWASLTPEQRVEETWRLTVELWEMNGWDVGEPGRREPSLRTFMK